MRKTVLMAVAIWVSTLGCTVLADNHTLIVSDQRGSTIYELDPASFKILNQLKTDGQHEMAVSPDGKTIFASIPEGGYVLIIDATTFKEKGRIESEYFKKTPVVIPAAEGRPARTDTSARLHGLALNTDGSKLYITVEDADIPGVVVYDVKSGKVTKKIDILLSGGNILQIQPGTDKLYYPLRGDNRLVVIDTKNNDKILKIIKIEGGPRGIGFTPNGEVWTSQDFSSTVTVVDSKKDEVIKRFATGGHLCDRLAVSPDGRWAAVTSGVGSHDVAIIDITKKETVARVPTGRGPAFPLFSRDSSQIYVMSEGEGDIAVVDVKARKVTARHKLFVGPFAASFRSTGD